MGCCHSNPNCSIMELEKDFGPWSQIVAFALISACAVMIFFVHLYLNMNTMVKQEINQIQMSKIYVNGQDKVDTGRLTIKLSIVTI